MSSDSEETGVAQRVFLFVFVDGILEVLGMVLYLSVTSPAALDRLRSGGVGPGEPVSFLLASPDRLAVAVGLAVLALVFAWNATPGWSRPLGAGSSPP